MTEFAALIPKTYRYLIDANVENKKAKGTKICALKRKLKFDGYEHCLEAIQLENILLKKISVI